MFYPFRNADAGLQEALALAVRLITVRRESAIDSFDVLGLASPLNNLRCSYGNLACRPEQSIYEEVLNLPGLASGSGLSVRGRKYSM